ncbi:hypothetical protein KI387_008972, partial [Taxus chinensis]
MRIVQPKTTKKEVAFNLKKETQSAQEEEEDSTSGDGSNDENIELVFIKKLKRG